MILDGKKIAKEIYDEIKNEVSKIDTKPKLSVILVGDNESSIRYVKQKEKWANYTGIQFELLKFNKNIEEQELLNEIENLNKDKNVNGFIVQLPIPKHINTNNIINSIRPEKDVDGFHPINQGKVVIGDESGLYPCTPAGVIELLTRYNIEITGKNIVMVGSSNIVGKPIANILLNKEATVTICNSKTPDISKYTKDADIVITATGVPGLIKKEIISDKTVIIDVGFTVIDGKIYGDADFENINNNGNKITPVPGGVGPLTVALLMKNTLKASKI